MGKQAAEGPERSQLSLPQRQSWRGSSSADSLVAHASGSFTTKQSWLLSHGLHSQRSLSFGAAPQQRLRRLPEDFPHSKEDYDLLNLCGEGATAKVHRAVCKPLGQVVAVKIVDLESVGSNLETVIHEAQMMSGLRHKNVLGLLASFVEGHYLWMVLPYVQGGSVESAMNYAFPTGLEERVIAPIAHEVLRALEYLHRLGIVHRDVKASNILLDRESVVLGDFGIAACMDRCMSRGTQAAFGRYLARTTFVGTPVWMAPEVIEQSCGHGMKADIYSFGMTLLEMACGQVPYAGMPFEVVALNKLHHPSPTLPAHHEGRTFSADMQHVVAMCLETDPAKRPTARQLLQHRFFKWTRAVYSAVDELLAVVPPPVQRLDSLTRRMKESLRPADETNAADERVSFVSLRVHDAFTSTQRFDAEMAQLLLQRMVTSSGVPVQPGSSPESSGWGSNGSTPRKGSFTRRKSFARGSHWPHLPACALKHCRGILFSSAGRKGFGLQTMWGHGFVLAHIQRNGRSCWSGPCYVYVSGSIQLGLGENIRESVVLFSASGIREKLAGAQHFKMSELRLLDAVGDGLDAAAICDVLQEGAPKCHGIAFRHYSGTKAWKNHGIVHLDEAANERVYGTRVSAADILDGRVKPPDSFRALVDDLIACEEGRYPPRAAAGGGGSDGGAESDGSAGLRSHLSTPVAGERGMLRVNSLSAVGSADGLDAVASGPELATPTVSAPVSVFAQLQRSQCGSGNGSSWDGSAAAAMRNAASAPEFSGLPGAELAALQAPLGGSPRAEGGSPRSSHTSGLDSAASLEPAGARGGSRAAPAPAEPASPALSPRPTDDVQPGYAAFLAAAASPFDAAPERPDAPGAAAAAAAAAAEGAPEEAGGQRMARSQSGVRPPARAELQRRPPKPPRQGSATQKEVLRVLKSMQGGA